MEQADMQIKGETINKVVLLPISLIKKNPAQPRTSFNIQEIESLAASIVENGLLQPLTVRRIGDHFELISGERRLRALVVAKSDKAPCIIVETTDEQSAIFALLENLQRSDLNFFEEAIAMKRLMEDWNISQQELGARLGKAQSTVANKLRLLKFDEETQQIFLKAGLNERQVRALLRLNDQRSLNEAVETIVGKSLNVSQTERLVDSLLQNGATGHKTFHPMVKDVRIFFNTISNAISIMNQSGINAISERKDCGEYIEYIVKIPI